MLLKRIQLGWYWFCVWACRLFCSTFFSLRIYGRSHIPDKGAFVLISNHQSLLDPVFCGMHLKRHLYFLARDTLFKNRAFGLLISSLNTLPVKRGQADLAAMRKLIRRLREGNGVCLFPEATRTEDGRIRQFKPGFGLLCRRGNAAVVPVVIDGAYECWPRQQKIFVPGGRIMICYGKPIPADEVKDMTDKQLAEKLTNQLRKMQEVCRRRQGKEPYNYDDD